MIGAGQLSLYGYACLWAPFLESCWWKLQESFEVSRIRGSLLKQRVSPRREALLRTSVLSASCLTLAARHGLVCCVYQRTELPLLQPRPHAMLPFSGSGILTHLSTKTRNFDRMLPSWVPHILPTPTSCWLFSSMFLTPPSPLCSWSKQDNLLLWLKVLAVHQPPFICSDPHQPILSTAIRGILKTWKCGSLLVGPQ